MSTNRLVTKSNALINAAYTLDLTEQRMILMGIVMARRSGVTISNREVITIHARDFAEQFGVTRQAAYEALRGACEKLLRRRFRFQEVRPTGTAEVVSAWVQRAAYIDATATVELMFSYDLIPLITDLESRFTSYDLAQVSGLTSSYALRLYEVLIAWRSVGKTPTIPLDDFRTMVGVREGEYARMHHLKSRVLDASINQINEHTDITAAYEQHKRGRKITGFSFTFTEKKAASSAASSGSTGSSGRKRISRSQAAAQARPGENWDALYQRLSRDFVIGG